ncbi:MAG TPA: 5-dehydro-2-deoxygluconokinase, partial [Burkholderiales bacterium]|nr:5-dehydro-2-deoxygluconokinase [Burkholderiales bacterium]
MNTPATAPERTFDVICVGRAAVDLYGEQVGGRLEDMLTFAKYLGGSPANTAVGCARLGLRPAMLTRVGDEHNGRFVRETLAAEGVDVSRVATDPQRLTALVFLGIRDRNTFPLVFYRENCADMAIAPEDFDAAFVASATGLLLSGTHLSTRRTYDACRAAMRFARAAGTRIVLDVDYRPVLWGLTGLGLGEQRFIASDRVSEHLQTVVGECDLIVGTEEEIHVAGGTTDTLAALRRLRELTAATLVLKRGPMGCVAFPGAIPASLDQGVVVAGFPVEVYNVLGAGDAFMAGFLRGWLRDEPLGRCAAYANACGALVVSRHGCAPAIPSWTELEHFLAHGSPTARLRKDAALERLHRVTTRTRRWPSLAVLAFDHRAQLEALADEHGAPRERIRDFKRLVAEGAVRGAGDTPGAGVILDDRYGEDVLPALTGRGLWIARPVEVPGSRPLAFEAGDDLALALRTWPGEHVAKCLVSYHPDDAPELRRAQIARLAALQSACAATSRELLVEVLPPRELPADSSTTARSLAQLYEAGIRPDWWKLPPAADARAWAESTSVIERNDRHCRGVVMLGLEADEATLRAGFEVAAQFGICKGFAVGRSIFAAPARAWFAGKASDGEVVDEVAGRYARLIGMWQRARSA